jgi:replicative DNA helicase
LERFGAEAEALCNRAIERHVLDGTPIGDVVTDLRDRLNARLLTVADRDHDPSAAGGPSAARTHFRAMAAELAKRIVTAVPESLLPVPMPPTWAPLSTALRGGWQPGVHVFCGKTGSSKTAFGIEAALHASEIVPTLYFGAEATGEHFILRFCALKAGQEFGPWTAPKDVKESAERSHAFRHADDAGKHLHIVAGNEDGLRYSDMLGHAKSVRELYPDHANRPMFIVVDYLQQLASPRTSEDVRQRCQSAMRHIRNMASSANAAVLVISSISRAAYHLVDARLRQAGQGPDIGSDNSDAGELIAVAKESGELEYGTDTLIASCFGGQGRRYLGLAKLRAGQPCWLPVDVDGGMGTHCFEEVHGG